MGAALVGCQDWSWIFGKSLSITHRLDPTQPEPFATLKKHHTGGYYTPKIEPLEASQMSDLDLSPFATNCCYPLH
jgi:hypothetical protein